MFSFFKKRKNDTSCVKEEKVYYDINSLLENLSKSTGDERVELLNTIGEVYFNEEDFDKAMIYYEESIALDKKLGKAYSNLMKIYNIKRRMAAEKNMEDELQIYLSKIDDLLKLSKDSIRGLV